MIDEIINGKRALHVEMPMTGKAKRKRIYNWLTYQYEEVTVIELGVREFAPSMSYAERKAAREGAANRRTEPEAPPRKTSAPPQANSWRAAIHDYLRKHGATDATTLATKLGTTRATVNAMLHKDELVRRVNGRTITGRGPDMVRWVLVESEVRRGE